MARITFEEYQKFEQQRASGDTRKQQTAGVRYFSLAEDGDSAIVRFNIKGINDLIIEGVHRVKTSDGKTRTVSCLRESAHEPLEHCPLCANGENPQYRVFLPMIMYTQEDNGTVSAFPAVWDQGIRIRDTLKSYVEEFGDLTNYVFKITRHGKRGDMKTTYQIMPTNQNIYKEEVFVKDFSAFEDPNYLERFVMHRDIADIQEFMQTGDFPLPQKEEVAQQPIQQPAPQTYQPRPQQPMPNPEMLRGSAPVYGSYTPQVMPTEQPATQTTGPRRYSY